MDQARNADRESEQGANTARLRLLGVPALLRRDGGVHFLERLEAALLARLLLDGPASRAEMAALLWPEVDTSRARGNLRQRLRRLKTAAGFDPLIDADPLAVRTDLSHDLGDHDATPAASSSAGGELLAGLDYSDARRLQDWVIGARERVGAARRSGIERRADQLEAAGELVAALRLGHRLLEIDPLDEAAHRRVMRLHHARGDRAAALQAFHHCRDVLSRELGAAPNRETVALAAQIEAGATLPTVKPKPLALTRPPRLIGREPELAAVAAGWQRVPVVAVMGEAGIGKSRLIAEVCSRQPVALSTGARPGDAQVPFALLVRTLRELPAGSAVELPDWVRLQLSHLLPELGRPASPALNPLRLRQALQWWFANQPALQQGLVVVDDLQFADEATLELLPALLDAEAEPPLRWLLAARTAEVPPLLRMALEGGDAARAAVVHVLPLDLRGVQALLESLSLDGLDASAWAEPLHRHTGGNPMFVLQTLMAMASGRDGALPSSVTAGLPLPGSVGSLIDQRLARLSAPARELAQVAALAGQDFDARLAVQVLAVRAADLSDAWRELEAARVLRDEAFAHDLVFEATLRSVPQAAAAPWHARIAAHLETTGAPLPRIAAHWEGGAQWGRAGRTYFDAAAQIKTRMRKFEEAALLIKAATCFEAAGDTAALVEACWRLYFVEWKRKDRPAIREAVARLKALESLSPRVRRCARHAAAMVAADERPDDVSLKMLLEVQSLAEEEGDREIALGATSFMMTVHAMLNQTQQATKAAHRLLASVEGVPRDLESQGVLQNAGATLELCGHIAEAEHALRRAEDAFRTWDDPAGVGEVQCFLSVCAHNRGQLEEAAELMTSGRRALAEINGGREEVHTPMAYQGRYWRDLGRLGEAVALLEDGHARTVEKGEANLHASICIELGLCWLVLGQPHRVHALIERPRHAPKPQIRLEGLLLEADLARAEQGKSRHLLEQAAALIAISARSQRYGWRVQTELSRYDSAEQAVSTLQRVIAESHERETWSHEGPARVRLVEALLRAGQPERAAEQAHALAQCLPKTPPMMLYAGEYHWAMVRAFEAAGDEATRRDTLRSAVARIERLARQHVPAAFRDSFLNRNPFNRDLRAAASRLGAS